MLDQFRRYYFYILLINVTLSANGWNILGLSLGQLLYWCILFLSVLVLSKTSYLRIGIILLFSTFILKALNFLFSFPGFEFLGELVSAIIFILVGSILYGKNYAILYRQLLFFFSLSIPFMVLQKIGVHSFFYGWNTELFHENYIYSFDEVKDLGVIFKNIPLFPTLFVNYDNLTYVMYQGRPTGLLYSNNVLSVLFSLFLALHFSISTPRMSQFRNIFVISMIISLIMSTLVFGVITLLFVYFYFVNKNKILRKNALKTFTLTLVMLGVHYLFFPGLTVSSLGLHFLVSFVSRFDEIFQVFGLKYFEEFKELQNLILDETESYSLIGSLLKSNILLIYLFILIVIIVVFYKNLNKMNEPVLAYITVLTFCIITQFGVNFIQAPTFQIFLGIALYPMLRDKSSNTDLLPKIETKLN